ncbi:MAG: hypothetical protein ACYTGP_09685 [Planctomycetota bacterium]|jgi:hypothetical protein
MIRIPVTCLLVAVALAIGGSVVGEGEGVSCETTGPDLVVSLIPNVLNHPIEGATAAFSIATTACNIGDEPANWITLTPQHPVIGQNMFRLREGRFEQLGQSWLKHGTGAIQLDGCGCGCTNPGTNTQLGVGCSDPYSAVFNGTQGGLGPKFEVNAATGVFPFPPTDQALIGGPTFKRIQVAIADLDPAQLGGGDYFVEAQYVSADDATADNKNNNASYRAVSVTGSDLDWTVVVTGPMFQREPAIMAWGAADPAVETVFADVPGDGRFIVAWTATSAGGGLWQYEFAVHNLNSDRSAGTITIPLPPGAACTNVGFHDVDYHSGEPFDGTDWTASTVGDQVSWSTLTVVEDPMANALRWGTLYNYRFVADVEPTELTELVIGLFKTGAPASVTVPLAFAGTVCPADVDGNGTVGFGDILAIIGAWGPCPTPCAADLSGNGTVDFADVLAAIGAWGPCG